MTGHTPGVGEALELQVLSAVEAGHDTLPRLTRALGQPAPMIDSRVRWAIGEGLMVATQVGDTWTFALTEAGRRAVAVRTQLRGIAGAAAQPGASAGLGQLVGGLRSALSTAPSVVRRTTASRSHVQPSASSVMLSPTEEAARAERAAWGFAFGVVGVITAIVLLLWLLIA